MKEIQTNSKTNFIIVSGYDVEEKRPFVGFRGPPSGILSIAEAYKMAIALFETIEAANIDAFIIEFAMEKIGVDLQQAMELLIEFRTWREKDREAAAEKVEHE